MSIVKRSRYYPPSKSWTKRAAWAFVIPMAQFAEPASGAITLMCQVEDESEKYHELIVPVAFLRQNLHRFAAKGPGAISLFLSAEPYELFAEKRGRGDVAFAQFVQGARPHDNSVASAAMAVTAPVAVAAAAPVPVAVGRQAQNVPAQRESLRELAAEIQMHPEYWIFPSEGSVMGFMGIGPAVIVCPQPSTSSWGPNHPSRRLFYHTLKAAGAGEAHLTDVIKRRGKLDAPSGPMPPDLELHVGILRRELEIVQPTVIIALGHDAYRLMLTHVPESAAILTLAVHFSYGTRPGNEQRFRTEMQNALRGAPYLTRPRS